MGQQQLLLLVLSTVIVGLATVAGIQAFSENQAQASQDALVQKGTSIASDIQGLYGKPGQLGGIDNFGNVSGSDIATRLGYETSNATVSAEGAGTNGECTISTSSDQASVECTSDNAPQTVTVTFDPDNTDTNGNSQPVTTSFGSA